MYCYTVRASIYITKRTNSFRLQTHTQTDSIRPRGTNDHDNKSKENTNDLDPIVISGGTHSTLSHPYTHHHNKPTLELSAAEQSLVSSKTACAWYLFVTFIIQHTLLGFAWYTWSITNGNLNISRAIYWLYWLLISVQFVLFMYYPFYAKIVLNAQILTCNANRKSLCLWKLCLALEVLHICYLGITTLIVPGLCVLHEFVNKHEPLFWCPINAELVFSNSSTFYVSMLVLIGLCFAFISMLVLVYMIHLDLKLHKIWQIENPTNYRLRGQTMTVSSMRMAPHPELPNDDPYNLEIQPSNSDSDM